MHSQPVELPHGHVPVPAALWDDPEHEKLKNDLIFASFDSHVMLTTEVGSRRISPM